MSPALQDLSVATGLFASLLLALECGYRIGRRAAGSGESDDARASGQIGAIQGALLGLLGLLLAFSFAAAGARFLERQDLIVQEANAIGTAYLRADLLEDPHRIELKESLRSYAEHRVESASRLRHGITDSDAAEAERLHGAVWRAARDGAAATPSAAILVLPAVNELIDLHAIRVAAGHKRLPLLILGLLIVCSWITVADVGFGCGVAGRRRAALTIPLALLVGTALWITIDLDQPRAGLLQLNDEPLRSLKFEDASRSEPRQP